MAVASSPDEITCRLVAVVPARAGSTRVRNKNLAEVGGRPLIERAIDIGRAVASSVVVSTDIGELLAAPAQEGVEVIRRPEALAGAQVTMDDVLLELAAGCASLARAEYVLLLQPTSPFRNASTIMQALRQLDETPDAEMIFSVHIFLEDLWDRDERGFLTRVFDGPRLQQLRKKRYVENGNFYIFRREQFVEHGALSKLSTLAFVVDGEAIVDINDQRDLDYAQFLAGR
jgi:CMP-N-acetylneuraminic acid synthetase